MMQHWIIIYDIKDKKRLVKVAKKVEEYAFRVQKSVFECYTTDGIMRLLRSRIKKLINEEEDSVIYFKVCQKCWQKQIKYGYESRNIPEESDYYIF